MNTRSKARSLSSFMLGISILTLGMDGDMRSTYKAKPKSQCSLDGSKPNKRRAKVKASRKANIKNRK